MNTTTLILGTLITAIFVYWSYLLLKLSQKIGRKPQFYILLLIPVIILLLYYINPAILSYSILLTLIISTLITLYLGFWAYTLYEVGGEDKRVWFYLILLLSPLWILYRIVEIR